MLSFQRFTERLFVISVAKYMYKTEEIYQAHYCVFQKKELASIEFIGRTRLQISVVLEQRSPILDHTIE